MVRMDTIDRDDFAPGLLVVQPQLVASTQLHFLRRIAIALNRALLLRTDVSDEFQPGDGAAFVEKVLFAEGEQPEVLPPDRLVLAAMPVQEVGEDSPCGIIHAEQLHSKAFDFLLPLAEWLGRLPRFRLRARHADALCHKRGALLFEPVARGEGWRRSRRGCSLRRRCALRAAISATWFVSTAISIACRWRRASFRLTSRVEPVQRFDVLDRIPLDAGAQALTNDGIEIDERLRAQQCVDLPARLVA